MYRGGQKNQEPFLFLLNGFCEWFFPSHHTICKLFVFFKEETVCFLLKSTVGSTLHMCGVSQIFFRLWSNGFASKNIKSRTSEDRTRVVGLCVPRHTIGARKQIWRPNEYQNTNGHMTYFRPMILARRCKRSQNSHVEIVMTGLTVECRCLGTTLVFKIIVRNQCCA